MKKLIVVLTIILSVSIISSGCSTNNKVIPKDKVEDIEKSGIRDQSKWQEYTNKRFGFSISFPKEWYKGKGSQNNDGVVFYTDNSNFDIRVYASHYLEGFSKPYKNLEKEGFTKGQIELNKGQIADLIKGEEDSMSVYEMVFISDGIEYHFYAKVTKDYAKEYEDVILNVIKTFNPSLEESPENKDNVDNEDNISKQKAIDKVKNMLDKENESYRDIIFDFERDNKYIVMSINTIESKKESEPLVQKTWYVIDKESGKIEDKITGGIGVEEGYSKEKQYRAESIVTSYLDIKDGPQSGVEFDHMKDGKYIIRAYKIVKAGTENGHVVSTGWYEVDIENETVKSIFE